jgi:hypothetical protein
MNQRKPDYIRQLSLNKRKQIVDELRSQQSALTGYGQSQLLLLLLSLYLSCPSAAKLSLSVSDSILKTICVERHFITEKVGEEVRKKIKETDNRVNLVEN